MARQTSNNQTQRKEVQLDLCAAIDPQIIELCGGKLNLMPDDKEDINLSLLSGVIATTDIDKSKENPIYKKIEQFDVFEMQKDKVGYFIEQEGKIWRTGFIKNCLLSGELKAIGRCYG